MTVITSGQLTVGPDDFQFTFRGKSVAIKVRSDFGVVVGCLLGPSGWAGAHELFMFDQGSVGTVTDELAKAGGAMNWVRTILVPRINAWLAELFPPLAEQPADPWQQLDAAIFRLRLQINDDGTAKVEA